MKIGRGICCGRDMRAFMVHNLARIGLLTERVRPRLATLGIELPPPVRAD